MRLEEIIQPDKKGVFYGRYSTRKQDMKMQLHSAQKLIEQFGCAFEKQYLDNGVSATKKKLLDRPSLNKLLNDAGANKIDYVVVYSSDRLARDPIEHLFLRQTFSQYNIPVVLSNTKSLYDTGDLIPQLVKDGMTKFESDNNRDRTSDTFKYKVQKGEWTGGRAPYGFYYDAANKILIEVPEEIENVKQIFNLYKQGYGFQVIAKQMSSKNGNKRKWTKEAVKTIITNPFYTGYMSMNKRKSNAHNSINDREDWIMGKSSEINPIISLQEWEYCFNTYDKKRKGNLPPRHFTTYFLLKELLFCKKCDCKMYTKNQKTKSSKGKEYGSYVYYCKQCKLRIETGNIHKYIFTIILNVLLTKNFEKKPEQLFNDVKQSFDEEKVMYLKEIKDLEISKDDCLIQLEKAKEELKLHLKNPTMEAKEIIDVLLVYQNEISQRLQDCKQLIDEKNNKIKYIDLVLNDFNLWNELYEDLFREKRNTNLRRLAVHLIDKVYLEKINTKTELYETEKNIHKGIVDEFFLVDLTAKIDLETEHFLDIDINVD